MSDKVEKILDVGCGCDKMPNALGIDIDENSNADIIHDLDIFPYPVEDNSFDKIFAKHIIEHLDHPQEFIAELYRIIKIGGEILIETPHFSNYVCYTEHQHKLFYSYFLLLNLIRPLNMKIVKYDITFYKTFRHFGIQFLANKNPRNYERFWPYIFPAENLKLIVEKVYE